jgi:peptidoglycan glycosyltransferase
MIAMNRMIRRVGIAVVVLLLALVCQLTYLQVVDAKKLDRDPRNVRRLVRDYSHPRGEITTADGMVAAKSVPSNDLFKLQRQYPFGPLLSQIVGFQSYVVGNTGVESTYNDALVGRDAQVARLNFRDILSNKDQFGSVVLTARADVQEVARQALGNQHGSVVALDPRTGAILAMYSNPSYDPNGLAAHNGTFVNAYYTGLNNDPAHPNLPRAYREIFAPGSTFKVVTAAVGLGSGKYTPDTPFPMVSSIQLPNSNQPLANFGKETCGGTLTESFTISCNTTFAAVGIGLGDLFPPGMHAFGIGERPPLDIAPGAVASSDMDGKPFATNKPFYGLAGIGQGFIAVTPLQMALVAAAVANNGVIMEPHVMSEIRDAQGGLVRRFEPKQWKQAMTPQVAATLTTLMNGVVTNGTGTPAQIPGVPVAGKTGTAQVGNQQAPNAWFIAFAPSDAPRFAVAVIVEHGGNQGNDATGGRVSAPIARQVLEKLLQTR